MKKLSKFRVLISGILSPLVAFVLYVLVYSILTRTSADLEIMAEQIRKTKLLGAGILAKNCGQTVERVMKDFNRDYWMDASESVEYGIVDAVLKKI